MQKHDFFFLSESAFHEHMGHPNAPRIDLWFLRLSNPDSLHGSKKLTNNSSNKRMKNNSNHETEVERPCTI